jgi:hypothetical protein
LPVIYRDVYCDIQACTGSTLRLLGSNEPYLGAAMIRIRQKETDDQVTRSVLGRAFAFRAHQLYKVPCPERPSVGLLECSQSLCFLSSQAVAYELSGGGGGLTNLKRIPLSSALSYLRYSTQDIQKLCPISTPWIRFTIHSSSGFFGSAGRGFGHSWILVHDRHKHQWHLAQSFYRHFTLRWCGPILNIQEFMTALECLADDPTPLWQVLGLTEIMSRAHDANRTGKGYGIQCETNLASQSLALSIYDTLTQPFLLGVLCGCVALVFDFKLAQWLHSKWIKKS